MMKYLDLPDKYVGIFYFANMRQAEYQANKMSCDCQIVYDCPGVIGEWYDYYFRYPDSEKDKYKYLLIYDNSAVIQKVEKFYTKSNEKLHKKTEPERIELSGTVTVVIQIKN